MIPKWLPNKKNRAHQHKHTLSMQHPCPFLSLTISSLRSVGVCLCAANGSEKNDYQDITGIRNNWMTEIGNKWKEEGRRKKSMTAGKKTWFSNIVFKTFYTSQMTEENKVKSRRLSEMNEMKKKQKEIRAGKDIREDRTRVVCHYLHKSPSNVNVFEDDSNTHTNTFQ